MHKVIFLLMFIALVFAASCDPVEEKSDDGDISLDDDDDDNDDDSGDDDDNDDNDTAGDDDTGDDDDDDSGWDFPYYMVIGGGLSETIDLVTVNGVGDLSIQTDVRQTGSAINQALVYRDELFAVCSLSHSAIVYNLNDLAIEREISLGLGNNPMAIAFHKDKEAYTSNYVANNVTLYDLADDAKDDERLLATIELPTGDDLPSDPGVTTWPRPSGLVYTDDRLYVALSNLESYHVAGGPGLVIAIDTETNTIAKTIVLEGRDAIDLKLDASTNRLFVTAAGTYNTGGGFEGDGMVEVIDLATETVIESVDTGGAPFEMTICPNRRAYAGNGKEAVVLGFHADTYAIHDSIDITDPDDPIGLSYASALACDGNNILYALDFNHDMLFVIDTENDDEILDTFGTGDGPDTLTLIHSDE